MILICMVIHGFKPGCLVQTYLNEYAGRMIIINSYFECAHYF